MSKVSHFSKAFTLIELLIVVAILSILSIVIISAFDPIEKINRSLDMSVIQTMENVSNAATRYIVVKEKKPWNEDILASLLTSSQASPIIEEIINNGELKKNFVNSHNRNLSKIYFTGKNDEIDFKLCFKPKSTAYTLSTSTVFYENGDFKQECLNDKTDCYFCFGESDLGGVIADSGSNNQSGNNNSGNNMTNNCSNFNPELPDYPWTCNSSSAWSQYGCTNYCVSDLGCDGFCPSGQRHLRKNYYATGPDFLNCLSNQSNTQEDYCVTDPSARCDIKTTSSNPSDFIWDCTDPRRPVKWN